MQRYNLAKLAKRPKGTETVLPPIEERYGTVLSYQRALRSVLREAAKDVRERIIPLYAAEIEQQRQARRQTMDAPDARWFEPLGQILFHLLGIANGTVDRIMRLEAKRHTEQFMRTAKRALGIDLAAVVRQSDLEDLLATAALRNASLIRSLGDDVRKRVEQTVLRNVTQGNSVATLRKQLVEQFGIVGRRADIVARDQSAKLVSDLNRARHQQAGITEYIWATSQDERVRPLHRSLNGRTFEYGKPTPAEGGLPPGQPVMCRCVARAVVTF